MSRSSPPSARSLSRKLTFEGGVYTCKGEAPKAPNYSGCVEGSFVVMSAQQQAQLAAAAQREAAAEERIRKKAVELTESMAKLDDAMNAAREALGDFWR